MYPILEGFVIAGFIFALATGLFIAASFFVLVDAAARAVAGWLHRSTLALRRGLEGMGNLLPWGAAPARAEGGVVANKPTNSLAAE
jgi:hypothetical protein